MSQSGRRIGAQTSGTGYPINPSQSVALAYLHALEGLLEKGVEKAYTPITERTSRPAGRILLGRTIRGPWAHGRHDWVVVQRRVLTEDTGVNRILLAAGVRADYVLTDEPEARRRLRRCLVALSGAEFRPQARPRDVVAPDEDVREALLHCQSLLDGVPVLPNNAGNSGGAFSAWVNVERIFEEAVLAITQRAMPNRVWVGKKLNVEMFHALPGEPDAFPKRAEPDIVVQLKNGVAVLDAKYRRSGEAPTDHELYQLVAHAEAFGARTAALVAPALNGPPEVRWLGSTRGGCAVSVIALDPREVTESESMIRGYLQSLEPTKHLAS